MTIERFTVERRIIDAHSGFRWCVLDRGEFFCDRNEYVDAVNLATEMNRADIEDVLAGTQVDSFPIREGFREDHWRRVKEAREWAA